MSTTVKIWISIMLAALVALTAATLWRISRDPRARPVGTTAAVQQQEEAPPTEPVDLTKFEMTERTGERFKFVELEGQVWVASMFYSSCPHQCRRLNEAIAALQRDPSFAGVRFVSISVDPTIDTPQVLSEYAKVFGADATQWLFLQGDMDNIGQFGDDVGVPAGYKTHTRRLVLFDGQGRIRGYYRFNEGAEIAAMKKKVAELLKESEPSSDEPAHS